MAAVPDFLLRFVPEFLFGFFVVPILGAFGGFVVGGLLGSLSGCLYDKYMDWKRGAPDFKSDISTEYAWGFLWSMVGGFLGLVIAAIVVFMA